MAHKSVGNWAVLVELLESRPELLGASRSANLALARGFREAEQESFEVPIQATIVPLRTTWMGQPEVEVRIGRRVYSFVIDTGADMTVLASDVASACGVGPIGDCVGEAETSTSQTIGVRPAVVPELRVGSIVVKHHPVAIVDRDDLTFGVVGLPLVRIRGILGWHFVRRMVVELDFDRNRVVLDRPRGEGRDGVTRNLFWLGYPMVHLFGPGEESLLFGLDTGAQKTTLKIRAVEKLNLPFKMREGVSIGAGGGESVAQREVKDLVLRLGHHELYFDKIRSSSGVKAAKIVEPDGRLGIDVARSGGIRIDYPSGRIDLLSDRL